MRGVVRAQAMKTCCHGASSCSGDHAPRHIETIHVVIFTTQIRHHDAVRLLFGVVLLMVILLMVHGWTAAR